MDRVDGRSIHLSNASSDPLPIWLEPWALEFLLPPRGLLELRCFAPTGEMPAVEPRQNLLTVWGVGGCRIAVFINGRNQDSFSGRYDSPALGGLSPKAFVGVVFGNQPAARPGGLPLSDRFEPGRLRRMLRYVFSGWRHRPGGRFLR